MNYATSVNGTAVRRCYVLCVAIMLCAVVAGPAWAQNKDPVAQEHALLGIAPPYEAGNAPTDPAMQWYPKAGLGMFVHWGISSVDGKHELSWGMMQNCPWLEKELGLPQLTPEAYFKLADHFNPQAYDPEKWLRAAKEAGFGYAVLTTRHHDGYALWPSAYGDFSTRTKMGGRDLVRPFVEACRKVGLKVGFYYSPPDWYFNRDYTSFRVGTKGTPDSPHRGLKHEVVQLPKKPAEFQARYVDYLNGQITELMTKYGKIDLLWFDGTAGPKVLSQPQIRAMQPGIVINGRQHGKGDFETYEQRMPKQRPDGWWEYCFNMSGRWGYRDSEACKPAVALITQLVKCRTWGGNVLANFAPRPSGEMPDSVYRCLADVKAWMDSHGESVIDVQPGPYPEKSNVPVTVRGKTWYLFLLPMGRGHRRSSGPVVLTGVSKPKHVAMLGTGASLDAQLDGNSLTIDVPKSLRTALVDVIEVNW